MAYYLDLFSPETYEAFKRSDQHVSGFRMRQKNAAERIKPGGKLLCYMTGLGRWFGILAADSAKTSIRTSEPTHGEKRI
jgi:hypothetical protein